LHFGQHRRQSRKIGLGAASGTHARGCESARDRAQGELDHEQERKRPSRPPISSGHEVDPIISLSAEFWRLESVGSDTGGEYHQEGIRTPAV